MQRNSHPKERKLDQTYYNEDGHDYPDVEGLGYVNFSGGETLGFVSRVNGPGARAIPEFDATRYELEELTRLWLRVLIDTEYFCFVTESSGSTEWRELEYAERRIHRIRGILGEETIDRITTEVVMELGKRFNTNVWQEFLSQRGNRPTLQTQS